VKTIYRTYIVVIEKPSVVSLKILEHTTSSQDNLVGANNFCHASTVFVGVDDRLNAHEFAA